MADVLSKEEVDGIHAYWRAANYLSVGQIYLLDNPLLAEPLTLEHIKPRLLGHWGTTPGLNFIYVHLNRLIRQHDLDMIYIAGPGHGGPGLVANTYLEGTYSEVYPNISQDAEGMRRLFKQFSFPGGIPSHVAPETPGSIHEGGELGYSLSHAFGAAFDNPDLIVACVVGDGEAETGALATSWHSNKFLNPVRDGAVLPILHLNGYKIANPTVLARISHEELEQPVRGLRLQALLRRGRRSGGHAPEDGGDPRCRSCRDQGDPGRCARAQRCHAAALADDRAAHAQGLDRPEGGRRPEDRGLLALAPGAALRARRQPRARQGARAVDAQLPARGAVRRAGQAGAGAARAGARAATRRMGANPHANGGILLKDLRLPDFRDYAVDVPAPGAVRGRGHPRPGRVPARRHEAATWIRPTSACSARTRRPRTVWARCSR